MALNVGGIDVLLSKPSPLPEGYDTKPAPRSETIHAGYVHRPGVLPVPVDLTVDRDQICTLRDGCKVRYDVYRPKGGANLPIILPYGPFGKHDEHKLRLDAFPKRFGVPADATTGLEAWEGPCPGRWAERGYAVVHLDPRGVGASEGDVIGYWSSREGVDLYDFIEHVAKLPWSNGKVGMTGNSWLVTSQWHVAALRPPSLAAIAPWEGLFDVYRDTVRRGGLVSLIHTDFVGTLASKLVGSRYIDDLAAMARNYPLWNAYWESMRARVEDIDPDLPQYVVASFANTLHTAATFRAYESTSAQNKWLRIHPFHEWVDYYTEENQQDLLAFFDRFLIGKANGWDTSTPRVRLSIHNPGGSHLINRPENEWPLARTRHEPLFLADAGRLSRSAPSHDSTQSYQSDSLDDSLLFEIAFDKPTELVGHSKLRLWVSVGEGQDDTDVFVQLRKATADGQELRIQLNPHEEIFEIFKSDVAAGRTPLSIGYWQGPYGKLRVSHRALDEAKSTPAQPVLSHLREDKVRPGVPVPVDIEIWPFAFQFAPGERLRLYISGHDFEPPALPGSPMRGSDINAGRSTIHFGPSFDSHLLLPFTEG